MRTRKGKIEHNQLPKLARKEFKKIVPQSALKNDWKDLWRIDILDKKRQSVLGIAVQEVYCEKSRNEIFRKSTTIIWNTQIFWEILIYLSNFGMIICLLRSEFWYF